MPVPIESFLGVPQLIELIQSIKSGIPRVLPDPFFNLTRNVISEFASYRRVKGSRRLPKASQYGSPSREAPKQDMDEVSVKLIHTIENQQFGQIILSFLNGLQATGTVNIPQRLAEEEIGRQTIEFKRRFENLRTAAVTGSIANGKIWLAADGTFLPTSTGASVTIDYGVPSGNIGTVAGVLGNSALGWENPAADIIGSLIGLKQKAVQATGYPLKYAFYGSNIPGYMLKNTAAAALIQRNPNYNGSFLNSGDVPGGFQELAWIPVYTSFFEDNNGVLQQFFGPDSITFTPEITTEWYELLQGSYVINPNPGILSGVAGQALQSAQMPYGMFSYATTTNDPVGVKQVMGDTFLPVIKNGAVVYTWNVNY